MHTQPNPTPLATLIRSEGTVSGHRNLYCFHYDACLDVAVRLDYGGVEHRVETDPVAAAASLPGDVHVIASYTQFTHLTRDAW